MTDKICFIFISVLLNMLLLSFPAAALDNKEAEDTLVATVNGNPITLLDILADTAPDEKRLSLLYSGEQLKKERKKLRTFALNNIIDRKLVYAQFNKKGYKIPKQIIEKMLDKIAVRLTGGDRKLLEKKARQAGLTMADLREQARERVATSMLLNERCYKVVYITPKQVYDYYNEHKAEFTEPAQLDIQILYLKCNPTDESMIKFAENLKIKLADADEKTFAGYVGLHSQGPNTDRGGEVGWIREDKLRPEFSVYLKGKPAETIAGPITTDEGLYFIRIADRKEEKAPPFKDIKEDIRKKLSKVEEEKMYNRYMALLKRDAVIRILEQ